jgi:hypothetical protein
VLLEESSAAWFAAMRAGDFARAHRVSDAILAQHRAEGACSTAPRHEQWIWDGTALENKRVLVRCYHGLGDTIMFARFLPRLTELAKHVIVWAQPALIALLETLDAPLTFLPLHDGTPDVEYDVDVEIMELMHALRVTLDTLPAHVPYFSITRQRASLPGSIGLLAEAGDWDACRSVPLPLMADLAKDTRAYSFQLGAPIPSAIDASTPEVVELARRLQTFELVITADTMLAHLAGALAVPTWTLLPYHADWRWMLDRADSPWYPSMRLFRQPRPGDWPSVIGAVRDALLQ